MLAIVPVGEVFFIISILIVELDLSLSGDIVSFETISHGTVSHGIHSENAFSLA